MDQINGTSNLQGKLAVTYYNIMTKGIDYVEEGIALYQQKVKEQRVKYLEKQARYFGYSLKGSSNNPLANGFIPTLTKQPTTM